LILLTAVVLTLAGCGGGGGGGGRSYYTVQGNVVSYASTGLVLGITLATVSSSNCASSSPTTQPVTQTEASYTFPASNGDQGYPSGTSYTVCVVSQPTTQNCTVANPTGVVRGDVIGVDVSCSTPNEPVNAIVTGLVGSGLTLQLTGSPATEVPTKGATLGTVPDGNTYLVTVTSLPSNPSQTCSMSATSNNNLGTTGGSAANPSVSGTVEGAVTVTIACTKVYSISGSVTGLDANGNAGLVLGVNNDSTNEPTINSDGKFTLKQYVAGGTAYSVIVETQPQPLALGGVTVYCTVQNVGGSGTVGSGPVTDVQVVCRPVGQSLTIAYSAVPNLSTAGGVASYKIAPTGVLTANTGSPFEPAGQIFAASDPSGFNFYASAYDTNTGISTVQQYSYLDGYLQLTAPPASINDQVTSMSVDPGGDFLVVEYESPGNVTEFAIYVSTDQDTLVLASPPIAASNFNNVVFLPDPNNQGNLFIYVTGYVASPGVNNYVIYTGYIWGFTANYSSETVQEMTGSPWPTGLTPPNFTSTTTIDPNTKFLVAGGYGEISAFTIGSGGLLTPMANSPYVLPGGSISASPAFDASSQFLYVLGNGPQTAVYQFNVSTVNSTSSLVAQGTPTNLLTLTDSQFIVIDPSGSNVYLVPDKASALNELYFFKIDALNQGALVPQPAIQLPSGLVPYYAGVDPSGKLLFVGDQSSPQNFYEYVIGPAGTLQGSPVTVNTGLPADSLDSVTISSILVPD
jgi:hypothetical protein